MDKPAALELARAMLSDYSDDAIGARTGLGSLEIMALRAIRATDPAEASPLWPQDVARIA